MTDFSIQHRERNWEIWRMRVLEKRTLKSIGLRYGISRERVRQIVVKAERLLKKEVWVDQQIKKNLEMVMGALPVCTELNNVLGNMGVLDITLKEFTEAYTPKDVLSMPNCGRKRLNQLISAVKEVNSDVSDIWTTRHG